MLIFDQTWKFSRIDREILEKLEKLLQLIAQPKG